MAGMMTTRRLLGLAMAAAGVALLIAGTLRGSTPVMLIGMVVLGMLVGGLVVAVLQRAIVVMNLAAATRADVDRALMLIEAHPAQLKRAMAEAEATDRGERQKLRVAVETSISGVQNALGEKLTRMGEAQALQSSIMTVALGQALETLAGRLQALEAGLAGLEAHLAGLDARVEQASDSLREAGSVQDQLRRLMLEGNSLAVRAYRDIHAALDAHAETLGTATTGIDAHFVGQRAGQEALAERFDVQAEAAEQVLRRLGDDLRDGLARQAAADVASRNRATEGVERVVALIESLRKGYEADKQALKAFTHNEKKLRSLSRVPLQWLKTETVREVEALMQLRELLGTEGPTPLLGGWAMDPEAMLSLVELVLERKPRCIVELGSGTSSLWLAMALKKNGTGRLVSYDHLGEYAESTRKALEAHGVGAFAQVRAAPLVDVAIGEETYAWYSLPDAPGEGEIDLLIVDGPPGGTGPMARFPAIPRLFDQLREDAIVVVDDASRPDEKTMLDRWEAAFPALRRGHALGTRTATLSVSRSVRTDGAGERPAPEGASVDSQRSKAPVHRAK
ncbi:class I SAM-dependent methyltransferase [Marilutibacter spongiae]|uniref:Class I SAM-dependent methyltransferase n=1 Tax=Marilutibacter spongiae TaxID=2025720 RepID=A0A7W3TIM7_9GAMM|nr:class I SAM-dependent methyltransferase [Lysobacter spongiae]MBB1059030.1 class I SAM-dependent methyltransferase [Lysobacter spongiae]